MTVFKAGQKAWDTSRYDRIGTSTKYTKKKNTILERLEFQIEIVANRQEHALVIAQEMKRLIKPVGYFEVVKNDTTHNVAYQFVAGEMVTENLQSNGDFENYLMPYLMTLYIESDVNADVESIPAISAVILNYSGSLSTFSGSGAGSSSSNSHEDTNTTIVCCPLTGAVDFYTQGRLDAQGLLLNSSGSLILSSSTSEIYISGNLNVQGSIINTALNGFVSAFSASVKTIGDTRYVLTSSYSSVAAGKSLRLVSGTMFLSNSIVFDDALTGNNNIKFSASLSESLWIGDLSGSRYLKFSSLSGSEQINFVMPFGVSANGNATALGSNSQANAALLTSMLTYATSGSVVAPARI